MSQTPTEIIIANSYREIEEELISMIPSAQKISRLSIIVPTNSGGWHSYAIWGSKIDYEKPNLRLKNPIDSLPDVIGQFTSLEFLDISSLGLKKLNPVLGNLKKLHTLNISYNYLDIENEIGVLSQMEDLSTLAVFSCPVTDQTILAIRDRIKKAIEIRYTITDYSREFEFWFGWKEAYYEPSKRHKNLIALLKEIHRYYPIGKPYANYLHPGFKELQRIHRESVNSLGDRSSLTWQSFTDEIAKSIDNKRIMSNTSIATFPSFSLLVPLEETLSEGIKEIKTLHVVKSLLVNYYTIFISNHLEFTKYKELGSPLREKIIYGKKNADESEAELIKKIKSTINRFYLDCQFVDHHLLMTSKIKGGVPYGQWSESDEIDYPIYLFLFGSYNLTNIKVIE